MLLEFLPSKLVFPLPSHPLYLAYFPDYVRNPDGIPSIQCDFSGWEWICNYRIALVVVVKQRVLQALGSCYFYGQDAEDRTRYLIVHNLTSCRRRRCEEVDWKCDATNARVFFLLNSFFHHHKLRGFHGTARLGEAERNPLKKSQLARLWTPSARATEPGRGPSVRRSVRSCVPRSRKREKKTRSRRTGACKRARKRM